MSKNRERELAHKIERVRVTAGAGTSGTNTGDVTLGTANGLSLVGQQLSLALVGAAAGAMSAPDKSKLDGITPGANVTTTNAVTLSGKSISGANNALSAIQQSSLTGAVYARYMQSVKTTIAANSVATGLSFGAATYDSHSAVTNATTVWRFTAPAGHGGLYRLQARVLIALGGVNVEIRLQTRVNGGIYSVPYLDHRNPWAGWCHVKTDAMVYLNAGQFVELWIEQNTAITRDTHPDGNFTFVEIFKVCA